MIDRHPDSVLFSALDTRRGMLKSGSRWSRRKIALAPLRSCPSVGRFLGRLPFRLPVKGIAFVFAALVSLKILFAVMHNVGDVLGSPLTLHGCYFVLYLVG